MKRLNAAINSTAAALELFIKKLFHYVGSSKYITVLSEMQRKFANLQFYSVAPCFRPLFHIFHVVVHNIINKQAAQEAATIRPRPLQVDF